MQLDGEATTTVAVQDLSLLEKAALLTGKSVWETHDLPRHGVRSLWLADGPHGVRKQVGSADHLRQNRLAGNAVRRLLWDPVAGHLAGVDRVFVVPDGSIALVPFAALPV